MERKAKIELVVAIIFLGIIAYFPCKVLSTETDPNLQLLATAIILTIVLGGGNMLKSLFRSAEAEELKKMNRLKEEEIKALKFTPLEFWNEVEIRTTAENKKEICNVLYFTNHTKERIQVEGYYFIVFLAPKDKPLISTNNFHISGSVIEPFAVKQPVRYGWFNPADWKIESKGTYLIRCKVMYSYQNDTKILTNGYTLEWAGEKE